MKCDSNISFKAHVPVTYYATHPRTGEYVPVLKKENIRKCNNFVVRNLNGTAKKNKNDEFVSFFKSVDSDYKKCSAVHSVYPEDDSFVFLVTGSDVDKIKEMAKPIGIAKGDAKERTGKAKSFEAQLATNDFFKQVGNFFKRSCRPLKNQNGKKLELQVFFNPKYNSKRTLQGFEFVTARFVPQQDESRYTLK